MIYFLLRLLNDTDPVLILKELKRKKYQGLYTIQDDTTGETLIGGFGPKSPRIDGTLLVEEQEHTNIDWEKQWELFAPDYREGKARINLTPYGGHSTLLLSPGAGFGDLSHPTTALMLEMMADNVLNEPVVDIGTGSGILALAALLLGATSACGIDIDPAALVHARQNAQLNNLTAHFSATLPDLLPPSIFLMNMTLGDQQDFQPHRLNAHAKYWIVSGILFEQRRAYLALTKTWGWRRLAEHHKNGWLGWLFRPDSR